MSTNWISINPSNGNIGIGSSANNDNELFLYDSSSFSSNQMLITSTSNYASIQFNNNNSSNGFIGLGCTNITGNYSSNVFIEANNSIIFNAGGSNMSSSIPKLIITSNGNIGINTSNPSYTLDVNGTVSANCILYNHNYLHDIINNQSGKIYTKLRKYPPEFYDYWINEVDIPGSTVFTTKITVLNTPERYYGVGDYKISLSSWNNDTFRYLHPRFLFNLSDAFSISYTFESFANAGNFNNFWEAIDSYDLNTGNYTGNSAIDNLYKGAWIKIEFPELIILRKFVFSSYNEYLPNGMPSDWVCYGSVNGVNYSQIRQANNEQEVTYEYYKNNNNTYTKHLDYSFSVAYKYIAWVFTKISGSGSPTLNQLLEIEIYGDETNLNVLGVLNASNNNTIGIPSLASAYGSNGDRIILSKGVQSSTYPYSVGINTDTMWFGVPTNGSYVWYSNLTSNMFLDNTGSLNVFNDIIGFNNASDSNLKTNIKPFNFNCVDIIDKIKAVEFTWKDIKQVPENKKNTTDYGFIAQEVQELLPHIVDETSEYKIIKYEKLVPYLVKAIQELNICFKNYKK
jgi:hypothetical protein